METGYSINLRTLDSKSPVCEIRGIVKDGVTDVPISKGEAFVVVTLSGETVSIVVTGLNAEGIANLLQRLHGAIPQIVAKLAPPTPKVVPMKPPVAAALPQGIVPPVARMNYVPEALPPQPVPLKKTTIPVPVAKGGSAPQPVRQKIEIPTDILLQMLKARNVSEADIAQCLAPKDAEGQ